MLRFWWLLSLLTLSGGSEAHLGAATKAGIGAALALNPQNQVFISQMVPGCPAALSGQIELGDVLMAVDGWKIPEIIDNREANLLHLASRVVGEEGTVVELEIFRPMDGPSAPPPLSPSAPQPHEGVDGFLRRIKLVRAKPQPLSPSDRRQQGQSAPQHLATKDDEAEKLMRFPLHGISGVTGSGMPQSPTQSPKIDKLRPELRLSEDKGSKSDSAVALMASAADGDCSRIKHLVETLQVDINSRDLEFQNDSPLHFAAVEGQTQAVELMVGLGAEINAANKNLRTPLHYAAMEGHTATCLKLLQLGADANLENDKGLTPKGEAEFFDFRDTARAMQETMEQSHPSELSEVER